MFQFSGFASVAGYPYKYGWVAPFGHPRISPACGSPRLFAACHVLLRLWEPRHPPYALVHLLFAHTRLLPRVHAAFVAVEKPCGLPTDYYRILCSTCQ